MSRYEKEFISMDGRVFSADVYSVLAAFGVRCPAIQHAIKKLLMPGQRGSKGEMQDLDEALASVSRAIDMALAGLPLTGETEPQPKAGAPITKPASAESTVKVAPVTRPAETESTVDCSREDSKEPEPEPKPKLVTWRLCVWLELSDSDGNILKPIDDFRFVKWHPSESIPKGWCPIQAQSQPIETIKQLPEGQEPLALRHLLTTTQPRGNNTCGGGADGGECGGANAASVGG